jgi:site-specific recombinase XerD
MGTFDDAIEGYLAYARIDRGLAANTLESYARDLGSLAGRGRRRCGGST